MDVPFYDYSPIVRRPRLELPDGKRLAVWIGINVEHYVYGQPALSLATGIELRRDSEATGRNETDANLKLRYVF